MKIEKRAQGIVVGGGLSWVLVVRRHYKVVATSRGRSEETQPPNSLARAPVSEARLV